MEIVTMDAHTFEAILCKFEDFAKRIESLIYKHGDKNLGDWLDNQDVCLLLNISPRTLQTLRDNGTLHFSRYHHKIWYKAEDVKKMVTAVAEREKCNLSKQKINY